MKEFKIILMVQILAMSILGGVAIGSLVGHPVYITKIVKVMPEEIFPEQIAKRALKWHGTLFATKERE